MSQWQSRASLVRKRILLIDGHPDPDPARFCHALADAYAEGARLAGHEIRRMDIASLSFPILRDSQAFAQSPSNSDILTAQGALLWTEHLVFIFPLWLGSTPALLKAFMEGVGCGEFLLGKGNGPFPKGKLAGRTARIVVTMGMPSLVYRLFFRAHGTKAFEHGILRIAGVKPVRTTYIGNIGISVDQCRRSIGALKRLGEKAG
jgi:putative NADPH-quinone reductase